MITKNKKEGKYLTPEPKDRNFDYPIDAPNAQGLVTAYKINTQLFGDPMRMAEMEMDNLTFGGRNKRGKSGKRGKSVRNKKNTSNKMSRKNKKKNKNRMSRKNKKRMSRKKKQL